jgi:hypothetical protein
MISPERGDVWLVFDVTVPVSWFMPLRIPYIAVVLALGSLKQYVP